MVEESLEINPTSTIREDNATKIDAYELRIIDDIQYDYEYGKLYLIGENSNYWLCAFHCPCGCGELLELLLLKDANPHWNLEILDDKHINLSPSVWKIHGCKSHFFIKNNQVIWVPNCDEHVQTLIEGNGEALIV